LLMLTSASLLGREGQRRSESEGSETMRKLVPLIVLAVLTFALPAWASTQDIYIAQTAAGGGTGASCANALTYMFFNSSANWASSFAAGKISPGTTVHLCGTITGKNTANTNILRTQGNGLSGSPITILFEPGAVVESPACAGADGAGGCIYLLNDFITLNGGTNGTIENTSDGNSGNDNCLAGTCSVQQGATVAVEVDGTNDVVENLDVRHMCMHTFQAADGFFFQACGGIQVNGANALITQNTIDNAATGIGGGADKLEISYNTLTAVNHAITLGASAGQVFTGNVIRNNDVSEESVWDATDNSYHHNGIIIEVVGVGGQFPGLQIYYNYFHGLWSNDNIYGDSHVTNAIFLDANGVADSIPNAYIVRNVLEFDESNCVVCGSGTCPGGVGRPLDYPTNGFTGVGGCAALPCSPPNASLIANNTMVGPSGAGCWGASDVSNSPSVLNNVCATTSGAVVSYPSTIPYAVVSGASTQIDFNLYPGVPTSNAFYVPKGTSFGNINSWAKWSAAPYFFDVDCPTPGSNCNPSLADVALTASYHLGSSSVAIGAAANLTSAWCGTIPALCTGAPSSFGRGGANDGLTLPSTGNWDTGAYPLNTSVTLEPSNHDFGTVTVGSASAPVTFTLTNNSAATVTSISVSFVTGSSTEFVESGAGTCGSTLLAGSSCTFTITFTPSSVGAHATTLNVVDVDPKSPHQASLTGTGIGGGALDAGTSGDAGKVSTDSGTSRDDAGKSGDNGVGAPNASAGCGCRIGRERSTESALVCMSLAPLLIARRRQRYRRPRH
jgi:Abnormal spindle-like microcephaly-assoc'd, ASPM-SPD-2-Hydin